ncbi:Lrp/AsnC family transcriptional regulator [Pseudoroseicyclus aestuarii]|uniref:AsnC family transcriptional regulator n=1 Tax=Pseudoroseicyclus aestuarii TaxID=1795041 RepID=A0A318SZB2_9RHOB|nr:Lrp/AsnC family transcriptional regulator [Pseudoroseicyclus aestuarii]PYE85746.1 AsnC family transcriptional regulator [Pseudoroseicyclus aestuarii]
MLDDLDRRLLRLFQADPALSTAELAAQAGVPALKAGRRLARLQEAGVLQGQGAVIDWKALGYEVAVSLRVTLDKTQPRAFDEFLAAAREVPEAVEIQTFLGRVDVRLSVVARDLAAYRDLYRSRILTLPHIADIESLMTLAVVKDEEALPL